MKNLENNILEKIKKENIRPKSKWYFVSQNVTWSFLSIILLFISSLFSASSVFIFANRKLFEMSFFWSFFVFTIFVFIAAVFVSIFFFKKIKNNYRKSHGKIFLIFVPLLFILSTFIIHARISSVFDEQVSRIYPSISVKEYIKARWSDAQAGRLAGSISFVDENGIIFFEDIRGKQHIIDPIYLQRYRVDDIFQSGQIVFLGFFRDEIFYPYDFMTWKIFLEKTKKKSFLK